MKRTTDGITRREMIFGLGVMAASLLAPATAMADTQSELAAARDEYSSAMARLGELNAAAEAAEYARDEAQAAVEHTRGEIGALQDDIRARQAELEDAQDALADRIAANYKTGRVNAIEVLLESTDFEDLSNRLYYENKISQDDIAAVELVRRIKDGLVAKEEELRGLLVEQESNEATLAAEAESLDAAVYEMQGYVDGLSAQVTVLMDQAAAEERAAREAQYQAYLATQQAAREMAEQERFEERVYEDRVLDYPLEEGAASDTDADAERHGWTEIGDGGVYMEQEPEYVDVWEPYHEGDEAYYGSEQEPLHEYEPEPEPERDPEQEFEQESQQGQYYEQEETCYEPEETYYEQEGIYYEPEETYYEPEETYYEPEETYYESEEAYYEPVYEESYGTGSHVPSAVDFAFGFIGTPYVWGGSDPSGFDCSGLAQYCYGMAGYSIPRTTYSQIDRIQALGNWKTDMSQLSAGDLVFPHSGHVGIYAGGGMMVHSPQPGDVVKYASVYSFIGGGCPV